MKQLWSILLLLGLAQMSFGQLEGPLSGTLGPSEFHVIDTISVEATDTLTLMPGTTFNFDGAYPFHIYGTLLAEGTESDSIIFTTDTLANPDRWRGLRFYDSTSSGSRLDYCRIARGYATGAWPNNCGGGVCCDSSSPMFVCCKISGNVASSGGGVSCVYSSPEFANCIISENSAIGGGGGVSCVYSLPEFTNCIISENSAISGGGIGCSFSVPVLSSCILCDNSATTSGGGVYSMWSGPTFISCAINDNSATTSGGGMYHYESWSVSSECAISGNRGSYGGGVFCYTWSSCRFLNCTMHGNVARVGGAAFCSNAWPTFGNCTLSGNSADSGGAAFCADYSFALFNSTIVAFSQGQGIYFENSPGCSVRFCDIFGSTDAAFAGDVPVGLGQLITTNANGDSCDTYFNIFLDPMFVDTSAGDFHLLASSPCIDAGDPELPLDPDSTITDIGAFYFHQVDAEPLSMSLPTEFALHPNWPNPFNPTTTIRYDVRQSGRVQLTIYNLLGQEVIRLIDSRHVAGTYTASWNANNFPSGMYLCRMEAPGFVQTRKLVLVK